MSIAEKFEVIADAVYDKGVSDGKENYLDEFWDSYQQNGSRNNYRYAFYNSAWNDTTYKPKHDINITSQCTQMYGYSGITNTLVSISISVTGQGQVFQNSKIKTIPQLSVTESVTYNQWFQNASNLENITIDGVIGNVIDFQSCILLSKKSISSIVNHLSSTATGKSVTFAKEAVNNAFGINVDDASTFPEGSEFYNLRNSKANWTFNYI